MPITDATDTPIAPESTRFIEVDNQGSTAIETIPQGPTNAGQTPGPTEGEFDKTENVLDGFNRFSFDDGNDRTGAEVQRPQELPAERIFGKFDSLGDAEKSYKELERQLHDPNRKSKSIENERKLKAELDQLKRERDYYRDNTYSADDDEFDEVAFNRRIMDNPAAAFREEQERIERVKMREQSRNNSEQERLLLKQRINDNIDFMKDEYEEFESNRKELAEWMDYYKMDSSAIVSNRRLFQECYRDYLDANRDPEELTRESREAGIFEAQEKGGQMPSHQGSSSSLPPGPASDGRFVEMSRGASHDQAPAAPGQAPPRTDVDALLDMEKKMGIGRFAGQSVI